MVHEKEIKRILKFVEESILVNNTHHVDYVNNIKLEIVAAFRALDFEQVKLN